MSRSRHNYTPKLIAFTEDVLARVGKGAPRFISFAGQRGGITVSVDDEPLVHLTENAADAPSAPAMVAELVRARATRDEDVSTEPHHQKESQTDYRYMVGEWRVWNDADNALALGIFRVIESIDPRVFELRFFDGATTFEARKFIAEHSHVWPQALIDPHERPAIDVVYHRDVALHDLRTHPAAWWTCSKVGAAYAVRVIDGVLRYHQNDGGWVPFAPALIRGGMWQRLPDGPSTQTEARSATR